MSRNKQENGKIILFMVMVTALAGVANMDMKNLSKYKAKEAPEQSTIGPPPPEKQGKVRGYNYKAQGWYNYSDSEIRMMREKHSYNSDGSYIYTPGRHVPTEEELIEEYLESGKMDDLIEEYIDKYRD